MIKRFLIVSVLLVGLIGGARPALALEVGVDGDISVFSDGGACASVSFGSNQPAIVGQMSLVGTRVIAEKKSLMANPAWARVQPIAIVNGTSWSGCVEGSGGPLRNGSVTVSLNASGVSGDVAYYVKCVFINYSMTCGGV